MGAWGATGAAGATGPSNMQSSPTPTITLPELPSPGPNSVRPSGKNNYNFYATK